MNDVAQAAAKLELSRAIDACQEQICMAAESFRGSVTTQGVRSARSSLLRALQDATTVVTMLEVLDLYRKTTRQEERS